MTDIKTLEQKRQEALDRANRLKKQIDKALNGQKFVLGAVSMAVAEHEPERIPQILADIEKYATRQADKKRLEPFKNDLASRVTENNNKATDEPVRHSSDDNMSQFYTKQT